MENNVRYPLLLLVSYTIYGACAKCVGFGWLIRPPPRVHRVRVRGGLGYFTGAPMHAHMVLCRRRCRQHGHYLLYTVPRKTASPTRYKDCIPLPRRISRQPSTDDTFRGKKRKNNDSHFTKYAFLAFSTRSEHMVNCRPTRCTLCSHVQLLPNTSETRRRKGARSTYSMVVHRLQCGRRTRNIFKCDLY